MKTKCNCRHWSQCGVIGGGCCAKKLYGGRPSFGVCEICDDYTGPKDRVSPRDWKSTRQSLSTGDRWLKAAINVATGAIGVAKSTVGIGLSPRDVIAARRKVCHSCEHIAPCVGLSKVKCCGRIADILKATSPTCGCIIDRKVRVASQHCPVGKW